MTYIIIILLLVLSACFSGLNLGMMSLGPHDLKRKADMGDTRAAKIYEVRQRGNLLLVTLLLGNVAVNAIIAIFLGSVTAGVVAGIVSTLLITVFGEIIPQAVFSRYALDIGSKVVWLVKIFIFVFYPIAAPMAWMLNKTLGAELPTVYSKNELSKIITDHGENLESNIRGDESRIAHGALTFGDKKIMDVMVPRSFVVSLGIDEVLDEALLAKLQKHGYSRIPVLNKERFVIKGILYAFDLIDQKNLNKPVSQLSDDTLFYVNENERLEHALNAFIKKKHHMFVVVNDYGDYTGIITIEDILEEILGQQITDEFDEFDDIASVAKKHQQEIGSL